MTSIEFVRNRLRCAKRREKYHRGPWAGDKGGRHSERHGLAKDDVDSLTAQLQTMISNNAVRGAAPPRTLDGLVGGEVER